MLSRKSKSEFSIMTDIIIALIAVTAITFYYYGPRVLILVFWGIVASLGTDIICVLLRGKKYDFKDLSAIISGMTLALLMPASIQYNILVITCIISIVLGKQVFGGKENPIFNCVAVGFVFSLFCFGGAITAYPTPNPDVNLELANKINVDLTTSFSYNLNFATTPATSEIDLFLGRFAGPMGATHTIVLIICAIMLILRRSISAITFLSSLGTVMLLAIISPQFGTTTSGSIIYELVSGSLLFGLIFVACDVKLTPLSKLSKLFNGIILGLLIILFRHVGKNEVAVFFAALLVTPIGLSMNNLTVYIKDKSARFKDRNNITCFKDIINIFKNFMSNLKVKAKAGVTNNEK